MTSIEWLKQELWEQFKFSFSDNIFEQAKEMHKAEQENKFTEEQVREAISKSVSILVGQEINLAQLKELIIKSLKQPKK